MPTPHLLHPTQVTIERLTRDQMVMDVDAREPVHGARTTTGQTVVLPAQIKWSEKAKDEPQEGGVRERSSGYILCRELDMDRIMGVGQRLKRGDRISAMGHTTGLDLYIMMEEPIAHYPVHQGSTLIKYHFEDRHPVRQRGDL